MKRLVVLISIVVFASFTPGAMKSSISRHGLTWTFDKQYQCGQYVNGDWWVIGPVKVTAISPAPTSGMHGSMVNPTQMTAIQAYDSRMGRTTYKSSLLVKAPVTLNAKTSLISTISHPEAGARPQMKAAAVLTVVGSQPPADAFRPPYVGTKKPEYRTSQLKRYLLPNLAAVAGTPKISDIAARFERVWLEHYSHVGDGTQYSSPTDNMPGYGRGYSHAVGDAAQMLMLDEDWLKANQGQGKETLLIRFVQLGIDLFEIVEYGGNWPANGGLNHGRKWPVLLSGILLDHAGMKAIGTRPFPHSRYNNFRGFQEDCQTYMKSGSATFGIRNCNASTPGEVDNYTTGYRTCCTSRYWTGIALSARMMHAADGTSAKDLWNWDPFFGYVDHWTKEQGEIQPDTYPNTFTLFMWRNYRNNLPGPTGIKKPVQPVNKAPGKITASPNPMTNQVTFNVKTGLRPVSNIKIYDQTGNTVYHTVGDADLRPLQWCGTDYTGKPVKPGLYYYQITTGNQVHQGRIIKLK